MRLDGIEYDIKIAGVNNGEVLDREHFGGVGQL